MNNKKQTYKKELIKLENKLVALELREKDRRKKYEDEVSTLNKKIKLIKSFLTKKDEYLEKIKSLEDELNNSLKN